MQSFAFNIKLLLAHFFPVQLKALKGIALHHVHGCVQTDCIIADPVAAWYAQLDRHDQGQRHLIASISALVMSVPDLQAQLHKSWHSTDHDPVDAM